MPTFPFIQIETVQLGALAEGTLSFSIPDGETVLLHGIRQKSDDTFDVTGLRSSKSRLYSNASSGSALPGDFFADIGDGFNGLLDFPTPIQLEGNVDFFVDLKESGNVTNDIWLAFILTKSVAGQN